MPKFHVSFNDSLTDLAVVEANDHSDAAAKAANGLPGRVLPFHGAVIWVLDHATQPAKWRGWRCSHRVEISIGYLGDKPE